MSVAKVAKLIRKLDGFTGDARFYKLEPPLEGHEHVIVSAAVVLFSGPETYIFPATADGQIADWGELEGSFRGGLDHSTALARAGYTDAP